jgi:hypothetical protein
MNQDPDLIRIQGFDDKKLKNKVINLSLDLHGDLQASREAFSPQKRTPSTSNNEIY